MFSGDVKLGNVLIGEVGSLKVVRGYAPCVDLLMMILLLSLLVLVFVYVQLLRLLLLTRVLVGRMELIW